MKHLTLVAALLLSSAAVAQSSDTMPPASTSPATSAADTPQSTMGAGNPPTNQRAVATDTPPATSTAPGMASGNAVAADAGGMTAQTDPMGAAPATTAPDTMPAAGRSSQGAMGTGGPTPPVVQSDYPPCSRTVTDRCVQRAPGTRR